MKSSHSNKTSLKDPPEVYYQTSPDRFHMKDSEGNFRDYRKGPASTRLGFDYDMSKNQQEKFFADIYRDKVIDCVTEIGGARRGLINVGGKKVLVPREQQRIRPQKGDCPTINKYLLGMFGEEQFEWYKGWLKTWLDAYYRYQSNVGQVLIAIGETASGKTLLKEIHNHIFDGGAQPLKYMTGATNFNGELCAKCSWYIDDKLNDLGFRGKKKLKAECKEMAVAGELRFEFKNQTAFTASPCSRLLICCNYTEDSVSVIPDIDESTRNKISILNCSRKQMPMPARTAKERDAFMGQLKSEMPKFIHYLLNEHVITDDLSDLEEERMGVRGYHNEEAMRFVESYSYDGSRLLTIIDCLKQYHKSEDNLWRGNSSALLSFLNQSGVELKATATSIGRFLNQRIESGCQLIKKVGHREYEIEMKESTAKEVRNIKTDKRDESYSNLLEMPEPDSGFDEDAPYGRCFK